eukprot:g3752.t1
MTRLLLFCLFGYARGGLLLEAYPNGAWGGTASLNATVAALDNATLASQPALGAADVFSVEVRGSLTPPAGRVRLECSIAHGSAFVWLDDHVVCQGGNAAAVWGQYESDATVLPWEATLARGGEAAARAPLFLRATFAHPTPTAGAPALELRWVALPPAPAPPAPPAPLALKYVGCYVDAQGGKRDLPFNAGDLPTSNDPAACAAECEARGELREYVGLQDGTNCFCGDSFGSQGAAPGGDAECSARCPGNASAHCGAADRNSVWATGVSPPATPPPTPPPPPAVPVPASALSTTVPPAQATRLALQRSLLHGRWSTWAKGSLSAHALLPHGVMLKLGVCGADGACDEDATKGMVDSGAVRLGAHALDHSYTQLYFAARGGCNVSVETAQLGGAPGADWVALLTPVAAGPCAGASAVGVALFADNLTALCAAWGRNGSLATAPDGSSVTATPAGRGLGRVTFWADGAPAPAPGADVGAPHFLSRGFGGGGDGSVAFSAGAAPRTAAQVRALLDTARAAEEARYARYGALADAKMMSQSGMLWNVIYSLEIPGTFAPVSRGWGQPWVVFDWDNIFGAYQLSLDAPALAYSQLVAVIKTKTANGMVPNFWQPRQISYDRTEPPVGAKVLQEMYGRHADGWVVELLFDDLVDWTQWFLRRRRVGASALVVLGSDTVAQTSDTPSMQAARYESGLDNSPMYDGDFFAMNASTGTGYMQLWDVGMSSMLAMELRALANLSLAALSPPRPAVHARLSAQLAELSAAVRDQLWDAELGAFVNKFTTNGTFYRRVSPTSFYPLLAGIATDEQAATMATRWLLNASRFCLAPGGDPHAGNNSRACWWGLPSISADDPAFPPLGYWRGYTWGPMAQLTYWALQQYPHVPAVAAARVALARQMTDMGLAQWHAHRHVCENYNPGFVAANKGTDCTGDKFYHWGGLTAFISLIEAGHY